MLKFFYDSLDTLKQVKKPTSKEVAKISAQIFVIVIIFGIFFLIADKIFIDLYQAIYNVVTDGSVANS